MLIEENIRKIIVFSFFCFLYVSIVFYVLCNGEIPNFMNPVENWKWFLLMYTPTLSYLTTAKIYKDPLIKMSEII